MASFGQQSTYANKYCFLVSAGTFYKQILVFCDTWKTLSLGPAVNGYLFKLGKAKAAKGEGWAPLFISCAQDTVGL